MPDKELLRFKANVSRLGVAVYNIGGESKAVYRSLQSITDSLPTFDLIPLTWEHPSSEAGQVTRDNADTEVVGFAGNPSINGDGLMSMDVVVTSSELADAIAGGLVPYFSLSYSAQLQPSSGEWIDSEGFLGEPNAAYPYQYEIASIKGNSLALVEKPRMGNLMTKISDSNEFSFSFSDSEGEGILLAIELEDSINEPRKLSSTPNKITMEDNNHISENYSSILLAIGEIKDALEALSVKPVSDSEDAPRIATMSDSIGAYVNLKAIAPEFIPDYDLGVATNVKAAIADLPLADSATDLEAAAYLKGYKAALDAAPKEVAPEPVIIEAPNPTEDMDFKATDSSDDNHFAEHLGGYRI